MIKTLLYLCLGISLYEATLCAQVDENKIREKQVVISLPLDNRYAFTYSSFLVDERGFHIGINKGDDKSVYFLYTNKLVLKKKASFDVTDIKIFSNEEDLVISKYNIYKVNAEKIQPDNKENTTSKLLKDSLKYSGHDVPKDSSTSIEKFIKVGNNYLLATAMNNNAVLFLLNENFQVLTQYEYEFSYYDALVYDMQLQSDGNILVVGKLSAPYRNYRAFSMRINSDLQVVSSDVYKEYAVFDNISKSKQGNYIFRFRSIGEDGSVMVDANTSKATKAYGIKDFRLNDMASDGTTYSVSVGYKYTKENRKHLYYPILHCYNHKTKKTKLNEIFKLGDSLDEVEFYNGTFYGLYIHKFLIKNESKVEVMTINPKTCSLVQEKK